MNRPNIGEKDENFYYMQFLQLTNIGKYQTATAYDREMLEKIKGVLAYYKSVRRNDMVVEICKKLIPVVVVRDGLICLNLDKSFENRIIEEANRIDGYYDVEIG